MPWRAYPVSKADGVVERLHQTLVEAERDLRLQAEAQIRAYHGLMQNLVHRLGLAEHLDDIRHNDSHAPAGWGPSEWRTFFQQALVTNSPKTPAWGMTRCPDPDKKLRAQIQQLTARIEELEAALQRAEKKQTAPLQPEPTLTTTEVKTAKALPLQQLVERLKGRETPPRTQIPVRLRDALGRGQRYQREVQILWLLAQGLSIRLEVDWVLAQVNGLKPRSGSIRRTFNRLAQLELIETQTLRLSKPRTSLALARLTDNGRAVAQALGFEVREGEWERLLRLHEGDRFSAHTVAVLIFALHARIRGWQAEVMPEANGKTPPDVLVAKDGQRLFVEVERGEREKAAKWRNIAQLNGGRVALCAMTPDHRALLVGDCKKQRLPGVATDLESLISISWVEISTDTPLWLEEWS